MTSIIPLSALDLSRFESAPIYKALVSANRALAEFKGVAASIPNQGILINTLSLQEAKDSSEIENIITTHDELFRTTQQPGEGTAAAKEVARYQQALRTGFRLVSESGLLTNQHVLTIQAELELNDAGFRKLPGTTLRDSSGTVIYEPPQDLAEIVELMTDLESFINEEAGTSVDSLVRMALIHHQFESIHPFYDGNGRTGRIINVLYLVKEGLLDIPILYLSREIIRTKSAYYALLQNVRDHDEWEAWIEYILGAVERTAQEGIVMLESMRELILDYKHRIRDSYKFYSQDLINNLFMHPYTKIDFIRADLGVSRVTAARYLDELAGGGFLVKRKIGRSNYYVNEPLFSLLAG